MSRWVIAALETTLGMETWPVVLLALSLRVSLRSQLPSRLFVSAESRTERTITILCLGLGVETKGRVVSIIIPFYCSHDRNWRGAQN